MIAVPAVFVEARVRDSGEEGRAWVEALPGLVERLCGDWALDPTGEPPPHGVNALVLPVRRGAESCVLKVSSHLPAVVDEAVALRAWEGRHAVRLLGARPADGALLLERLDDARTLSGLDLLPAAEVAGAMVRSLAVPAPEGLTHLRESAAADEGAVRALLAALVGADGLDGARARAWTVVRAVDYWLWGLENGLTEDPVRCRRLLEVLACLA